MDWVDEDDGGFLQRGGSLTMLFVQHMSTSYYRQSANLVVHIFFFPDISTMKPVARHLFHREPATIVSSPFIVTGQIKSPSLLTCICLGSMAWLRTRPRMKSRSHTFMVSAVETNGAFSILFLPKLTIFQNCSR